MSSDPATTGENAPVDEDLLSGDDLERIDACGGCEEHEVTALARTALHHRQESMDLRDELASLRRGVERAMTRLRPASHAAIMLRDALHQHGGGGRGWRMDLDERCSCAASPQVTATAAFMDNLD